MRVRVALRALWALLDMRVLFNPWRFPVFSWQLSSHKLLRYMAFLPQFLAFVSNALLVDSGILYQILFALQLGAYALAGVGLAVGTDRVRSPLVSLPTYLVLLNWSCAQAFWKFCRGEKQVLWKPRGG